MIIWIKKLFGIRDIDDKISCLISENENLNVEIKNLKSHIQEYKLELDRWQGNSDHHNSNLLNTIYKLNDDITDLTNLKESLENWKVFLNKNYSEMNNNLKQLENKIEILLPENKNFEVIDNFNIQNDNSSIEFNLIESIEIENDWVLVSKEKNNSNFWSQLTGTSLYSGLVKYSSKGLYKATASANSLMMYNDGTISSIVKNGSKFSNHAGFVTANASVFTPILAFQFASMITGQYYFKGLNQQLSSIHNSINILISLYHNERLAKLRYISFKILEFNKRSFFTTEDYVSIDKLKYDLSIIRFEYLLIAKQEINNSLDNVNCEDRAETYEIISENTNAMERLKLSVKENPTKLSLMISNKLDSLYKDSVLEKGVNSVQSLFEDSIKKAMKLTDEIIGSKFFFYSDISLKAEHLYQLSKMLEFKMNLSDKNPDTNRIGKIKEFYLLMSIFNLDDSVLNDIDKLNSQLKTKLIPFNNFEKNSFINKNEIIKNKKKLIAEIEKIEKSISHNQNTFSEFINIKKGFEETNEFIIDNRNNDLSVYVKKTIANNM